MTGGRDLTGALRDAERQIVAARHHVQQRVQDLDHQVLQLQRDASAFITQQRLAAAGGCLAQAAALQDAARELRRVLDLL